MINFILGIVVDDDFYTDRCGYSEKTNGYSSDCFERHARVHWMSGCCSADGYGFAPRNFFNIKEKGQVFLRGKERGVQTLFGEKLGG